MMFLVAVDGSEASTAALEHALDVARAAGASVTLAHAVNPDVYQTTGPDVPPESRDDRLVLEAVETAETDAEEVLAAAAERAGETDVPVETQLLYGDPVETIAEFAADGVAGIFVGHRSLSARHERLLGSVAKGLVERAPVPVTVVRADDRRR